MERASARTISSLRLVGLTPERVAGLPVAEDKSRHPARREHPAEFQTRHPEPAQRGEGTQTTAEHVAILQNADEIVIDEIRRAGLYRDIAQAFAVLLPVKSVGVMGDERTYDNVFAVRAVSTTDFMTPTGTACRTICSTTSRGAS